MGILNIQLSQAGLVGTLPTPIYINTNDTYAVVTASGYLNGAYQLGEAFSADQMALVQTSDEGPVWLKVTVSGTTYSLAQISSPGDVTLPTIANHLMVSSDTAGTLANKTGVAINAGGLQAGLDATAGVVTSFPATTISGVLSLAAADNATGDFDTTISNATAVGQTQVISIPDSGAATGDFILSTAAATQSLSAVSFSTTTGIVGTTTNDDAAAGSVGQLISSVIASGSAVSLTTATNADVTSISLTAGDWDVWGNISFIPSGATNITDGRSWISVTSVTIPDSSLYSLVTYGPAGAVVAFPFGSTPPSFRLSLSGTTTVYLSVRAGFTVSTLTGCGGIYARRVR